MKEKSTYPILQALGAAILFGASTPLSKMLLQEIEPVILAGLLYLGCGLSAIILRLFRLALEKDVPIEADLTQRDIPWLAGAVIAGGILAPILLLIGLQSTPAATASILLNLEIVATVIIAGYIFSEAIGRRIWWAMALITIAGIALSLDVTGGWGISLGALAVISACFLWGLDNNLTRNVSAKDPLVIVAIKGLAAGTFSLLLGLMIGNTLPSLGIISLALLVGSFSYGVSITLFVLAMRGLGAARTGMLYATAPFIGATLSFVLLREQPSLLFLVSIPLMVLGVVLMVSESHAHSHAHEFEEHNHRHSHPEIHHDHTHASEALDETPTHAHWHIHPPGVHVHEHNPDLHHQHPH
ncbi:MAG: EamA family transporter [Anaerolineales bacterium]|nr:EamA family transporter [Anaerolineales bacterium]